MEIYNSQVPDFHSKHKVLCFNPKLTPSMFETTSERSVVFSTQHSMTVRVTTCKQWFSFLQMIVNYLYSACWGSLSENINIQHVPVSLSSVCLKPKPQLSFQDETLQLAVQLLQHFSNINQKSVCRNFASVRLCQRSLSSVSDEGSYNVCCK